jgi:hypothetical protein
MTFYIFTIAAVTALVFCSPVPEANPLGLSLGPLIPSIPGVTEPLASNAPPLPILQLPTPPLPSPPFTPSNIRPKKIGYFWTGAGDNIHAGIQHSAEVLG